MPFSGGVFTGTDGIYSSPNICQQEAAAGIDILALNIDTILNDVFSNGLSYCVLKDGTQTVIADIPMGGFSITNMADGTAQTSAATVKQAQGQGSIWCGTSGGTANAITLTPTPAIASYAAGQTWRFTASLTNTASTTYAVSGLSTPRTLKKNFGGGLKSLVGGEILIGGLYEITDNGTVAVLHAVPEGTQGADIASATTTDLSAATGDYVSISGTTTITALGTLPPGAERTLEFQGILTLTHNASSLILPNNGSNITTAAGDTAIFRSLGSGNWRCIVYQPMSGGPLNAITQGLHTIDLEGRAFTARTTNGATNSSSETTSNKVMVVGLAFDQSTAQYGQARFVMPQSWNASTITCRVRWTALSGSGNVIWGFQAVALRDNVNEDTAFGVAQTVTDTLLTANYEHVSPTSSAITIGNSPQKADTIILQVYRDAAAGGDTLNASAILLSVEVFMTINAATDA